MSGLKSVRCRCRACLASLRARQHSLSAELRRAAGAQALAPEIGHERDKSSCGRNKQTPYGCIRQQANYSPCRSTQSLHPRLAWQQQQLERGAPGDCASHQPAKRPQSNRQRRAPSRDRRMRRPPWSACRPRTLRASQHVNVRAAARGPRLLSRPRRPRMRMAARAAPGAPCARCAAVRAPPRHRRAAARTRARLRQRRRAGAPFGRVAHARTRKCALGDGARSLRSCLQTGALLRARLRAAL